MPGYINFGGKDIHNFKIMLGQQYEKYPTKSLLQLCKPI